MSVRDATKVGKTINAILQSDADSAIVRDFQIPLISGGVAVVKVPVPMSEADFAQLTGTLEVWKQALVRNAKDDPEVADPCKPALEETGDV
jgi:hypothetical protein